MNKFVKALAVIGKQIIKFFYPVKVIGPREFEQKKSLLVGNHISGWDPVIFTAWSKTFVSFVYKAEFRKSSFLRWAFDGLDFVPVKRGEVDIGATKQILRLLKEEKIVGLFPEGTRNPNVDCLQEFKTGAALFAIKSKAPLRVFYIWDKGKVFRKNYIMVGDEFTLDEFYGKTISKDLLCEATAVIKDKMDALRIELNKILEAKGVKRRKRTRKETEKIKAYNEKQKTLAKQIALKQQSEENTADSADDGK